jgi:hypothetical protein
MPDLPDLLTEDALRSLIRDARYNNSAHPEYAAFRRAVAQGFRKLYPGPAKADGTGRFITDRPAASSTSVPTSAQDHTVWSKCRIMIDRHLEVRRAVRRR